jgi:hypothetical protein
MRSTNRLLVGTSEKIHNWEDLGVDGWIILNEILRRWEGKRWIRFMWLMIGTFVGLLFTQE